MALWEAVILRRPRQRPSRRTPGIAGPAFSISMILFLTTAAALAAAGSNGLSLFGELKYPPEFKNFDYVNPDAPKGGTMKFSAIGTYDSLNPFVVKGVPAAGIGQLFD